MLLGEEQTDGAVVAGDVVVYRDLIASLLGARVAMKDSIGDARLVVLCPSGDDLQDVESLAVGEERSVIVVGVPYSEAVAYLEAGAVRVLPPEADAVELRLAVEEVERGKYQPSQRQTALIFERLRERRRAGRDEPKARLTRRELEVANLVAQDLGNKEIASRLFMSHSTVKKHVNRILFKLGVNSRREIAARLR